MKFCFHTNTVDWLSIKLDMKPVNHYMIDGVIDIGLQPRIFCEENIMEMCYMINEKLEDSEMFQSTEVLDRAYSSITAKEVASLWTHLIEEEQTSLEKFLTKYSTIFDGKLGCYPHNKIKLDIPPNAQLIQKRPYPVPYGQETSFKKEMKEIVDDGVLRRKHGGSEWASPIFLVPRSTK